MFDGFGFEFLKNQVEEELKRRERLKRQRRLKKKFKKAIWTFTGIMLVIVVLKAVLTHGEREY